MAMFEYWVRHPLGSPEVTRRLFDYLTFRPPIVSIALITTDISGFF